MTIELLNEILKLYTGNEVRFAPIYHSEYTTEFHLIDGVWDIEGEKLIYDNARELYHYEDSENRDVNGYVNEQRTHILTIAAYIADGVLVILS
jgi:hypothetical protein